MQGRSSISNRHAGHYLILVAIATTVTIFGAQSGLAAPVHSFLSTDSVTISTLPDSQSTHFNYRFSTTQKNDSPKNVSGEVVIQDAPQELLQNSDYHSLAPLEKREFYNRRNKAIASLLKMIYVQQLYALPFLSGVTKVLRQTAHGLTLATQGIMVIEPDLSFQRLTSKELEDKLQNTATEMNSFLCAFAHKIAKIEEVQLAFTVGIGAGAKLDLNAPQPLNNTKSSVTSFLYGINFGISMGMNFRTQEIVAEVVGDSAKLIRHYVPSIGLGGSFKVLGRFITEYDRRNEITGYGSMIPFTAFGIDSYRNEIAVSTILPGLPGGGTPGVSLSHNTLAPLLRLKMSRYGFSIGSAFGINEVPKAVIATPSQIMSLIKPRPLSETSRNELEWVTSQVDPGAGRLRNSIMNSIKNLALKLGAKKLAQSIESKLAQTPAPSICSQVFYEE